MWRFALFLLISFVLIDTIVTEDPVLYYYGLEESERGLPRCAARQACSVLLRRHWRPPALMRLCRCARRLRCDTSAGLNRTIELNNRAFFQFCQPVTDWPTCKPGDNPLSLESSFERLNPDELEEKHHKNEQLTPPTIKFTCRCRSPNYWKLKSEFGGMSVYECSYLPLCSSGEFCGNVNNDMIALYQSCLCPRHHICVHNGGVTYTALSELLYRGRGWKAFCQRIQDDYSYEDY